MRNCYSSPKKGAGNRREAAYAYIEESLKKMFNEKEQEKLNEHNYSHRANKFPDMAIETEILNGKWK